MTTSVTDFGKVAVLLGGKSAEREVSLISGAAVLEALKRSGVDAHAVDAAGDFIGHLTSAGYARVFNVLHGRGGEDGQIQGLLDTLGLPYTGSDVLASALSMDKYRTKLIWQATGLATPKSTLIMNHKDLEKAEALGFPLMIKPCREGSSIGMSKVDSNAQLESAWEAAKNYDDEVLAEQWITGEEYTCSLLNGAALPLIKLETDNAFYDYEAKYESDNTRYILPSGLSGSKEKELQDLSLKAFEALGAEGWGRIDIMLDQQQSPWLIEANTIPGMTSHSLVPMAAKEEGIEFDQLVLQILQQTMGKP